MSPLEPQRLSHLDAALFALETPTNHMHLGLLATFEGTDALDTNAPNAVVALLRQRVDSQAAVLSGLRLVVRRSLGGLAAPLLVDGGPLDLDYHVQVAELSENGSDDALNEWVGNELSRPLDRAYPLWQIHVISGLTDRSFAIFVKGHHGVLDGVAALRLALTLFDDGTSQAEGTVPIRLRARRSFSGHRLRLALSSFTDVMKWPLRVGRVVADPTRRVVRFADLPSLPQMFRAPRTPLNVKIGPRRSVARTTLSLSVVRRIRRGANCTGNDVVMAVVATSTRRLLIERNKLPKKSMVGLIPAAQSGDEWRKRSGNRLAFWFVTMATNIDHPKERLMVIARSSRAAKEAARLRGADLWERYAGALLPGPLHWAVRCTEKLRLSNIVPPLASMIVSNLTGPHRELRLAGAVMNGLWPFGPPKDGGAINVTMVSYRDQIFVGVQGDQTLASEVQDLAAGLPAALTELQEPGEKTGDNLQNVSAKTPRVQTSR